MGKGWFRPTDLSWVNGS